MADQISVTPELLIATANKVDTHNDAMKAQLDHYIANAQGLVEHGWKGRASGAFTATILRWNDDSKKVHAALTAIADQMRASANAIASQDEDTTSTFSH